MLSPAETQTAGSKDFLLPEGLDCLHCHTPDSWTDLTYSRFDHDKTEFPLVDNHRLSKCEKCHTGKTNPDFHRFETVSAECIGCHQDVHTGQLGTACENCHSSESWFTYREGFIHDLTIFPLTGKHLGLSCDRCHVDGERGTFRGTTTECAACHNESRIIADANVIDHTLFQNDCSLCHTPTDWNVSAFVHSSTGFPLSGRHDETSCLSCHEEGFFSTNGECFSCHIEDYDATTDPVHIQQIYPITDCADCHDASRWTESFYSHSPLPESCNICHLSNLLEANESVPGHYTLPNQCNECHIPNDWEDMTFDHTVTGYPLDGIHIVTECMACHEDGFYTTRSVCLDCHEEAFFDTRDPDHVESGFDPETCHLCHNAMGWEPAIFHTTDSGEDCQSCHDFNGETDPLPVIDHTSAIKLGDDINNCQICHLNTGDWKDVDFTNGQHDGSQYGIYFNIYSGTHSGEWGNSCTDNCHVFGGFNDFSCYDNCHESKHSRSEMLDEHCDGASCTSCTQSNGYWFVSVRYTDGDWGDPATFLQCYRCHPDGSEDGCGENDLLREHFLKDIRLSPEKGPEIIK